MSQFGFDLADRDLPKRRVLFELHGVAVHWCYQIAKFCTGPLTSRGEASNRSGVDWK
jgi:hypothetical protein